ncbi:MAG: transketolase C-terminal domain-containing protein [Chloroflexota bacterium]
MKLGKATRDAYGEALLELGKTNPNIVVVDGDVQNSTRAEYFAKAFPDRAFQVGIAESNLVGVGAGLAACGKIPFIASFAVFMLANAYDQLRMAVAFPHLNVKVVGSHAGISIGEDGPSQMGIEDVALACALPGFVVVVPADEHSARAATRAVAAHDGPTYLRTGRAKTAIIYADGGPNFELGKAIQVRDGNDVTIIANGLMVAMALEAAELLAQEGKQARVLDMHTVKPLDHEAVERAARETKGIVVAEEHLIRGGLGSYVAASVCENYPTHVRFIGLDDTFAESGTSEALLEKYGLTSQHILNCAREITRMA